MKYTITVLLLAIFCIAAVPASGHSVDNDEVLLAIPTDQYEQAALKVLAPLRAYQRLFEHILVGTDRTTMTQLVRGGIRFIVVDEDPWTGVCAVVSSMKPTVLPRSYAGTNVKLLYRVDDFDILKGSAQAFDQLRQEGLSCVEIERKEIPVNTTRTHLPSQLLTRSILDTIGSIVSLVSDSSIYRYIQGLSNLGTRHWNNANRDSVSRYVRARFLETGFTNVALDSFQYSGTWQQNVVATMQGTVSPSAELIVGGHHDDMPSSGLAPGADDNASGTAAVFEMARVLKLVNYQPAYTIRLMGFAAEEAGLRGSASYAQRARAANRDIRLMQNYDMIGNRYQAPSDNGVYVVWYTTSEAYSDLHAAMIRLYTPLIPIATTSYRSGSDSYSFWQQNYRTVFCIEKNFSPFYHTSNDLLQYLDMTYCASIVKSGLAMLLTLDQMPASVPNVVVRDWGDGSSLFASWDSVSVPDWSRYKVYVGRSPGVYDSSMVQGTRSRRIGGLTAGTRYYIGVSIVDLVGREGIIVEQSSVPRLIPLAPAGLSASAVVPGVKLLWRSNSEMDLRGYNIYRSVGSPTLFTRMNTQVLPDTTWRDTTALSGMYYYCITAIDSAANESNRSDTVSIGLVGVDPIVARGGFEFRLRQNYPNPFNPMTEIRYEVAHSSRVTLQVFDLIGREVATLVNRIQSPGTYNAYWDAREMPSGVYVLTLRAGGYFESKRMVLLK